MKEISTNILTDNIGTDFANTDILSTQIFMLTDWEKDLW